MPNLPTGTVTFLFTDIEGSTKRWDKNPQQMKQALARHDTILRNATETNGGYVFKTMGDAFYVAFPTTLNALAATLAIRHAMRTEKWEGVGPIRVRMALHTGAADERDGDYFGPPLNRVARLLTQASGDQIVLSQAAYELVCDALPQGVSLTDLGEHWLKGLSRPERVFELVTSDKLSLPPCPYQGLFAFQESHSAFFCGREAFTEKLVEAVWAKSFVAVIGSSGSGKSSTVFAGLIPAFRSQKSWIIGQTRPGDHPFQAFAATLIPLLEPEMSETDKLVETRKLADALKLGNLDLRGAIKRILQKNAGTGRFLLIVDQFEELYTLCHDTEERQCFLDMLLAPTLDRAHNTPPDLTVVITMRADFLGHALSHRPFVDVLQGADLKLGPMTRQEMQATIEQPAHQLNVAIEEGLTERILDAVGQEPGDLPLLEFSLTLLWEKQQNYELTHAGYDEIGGVKKALARYAEEVYNHLSSEEQQRVRSVFTQLVLPGAGTEDTRRLASRNEMREDIWYLVARLADARLVVSGRDDTTGEDTVEIVHEALIGGWGRLREWIEADREFRTWQERLRAALHQWQASNRDDGALLRGAPLAEAERWLEERQNDLIQSEQEFIRASVSVRERERLQRTRLRRRVIAGLAVGLVVAVGLALLAVLQWQAAEHHLQTARAQVLAAQAVAQERATQLGVLLAMEAISITVRLGDPPLPEAVSALHVAVLRSQERRTITGHTGIVWTVAYSPDGKSIVTASDDKTAKVWDVATGQLRLTLQGHTGAVWGANFSPDGERIATVGEDKTVRIWDAQTGKQQLMLPGSADAMWSAAFSPDGKSIATASLGKTATIWDAATGQERVTLNGHEDKLSDAEFSPDGKEVVTASYDQTAKVWDAATGRLIRTLMGHTGGLTAALYSPNGTMIATASGDGDLTAKIWDAATGKELKTLAGHTDTVTSVRFSADGKRVLTTSQDKTAKVWDVESGQQLSTLRGHTDRLRGGAFSPDGRTVVTAGDDMTVRLWDVSPEELPILQGHTAAIWIATYSPDGKSIVTASADKTARIWDAQSGRERITLSGHMEGLNRVEYSPDGTSIVTASDDKTAKVWDATTGQLRFTLQSHTGGVAYATFSPDGKSIVTTSYDKTAKIWNATTGQVQFTLTGHDTTVYGAVWGAVYSPDGHSIVTTSGDNTPRVWDADSGKLRFTLQGHTDSAPSAEYSPDGRYIVTTSADKTAKVWSATGGQLSFTLEGHTAGLNHTWFSPDGKSILTISADKTAKLWDASTGKERATLRGHTSGILWAAYSPDEKRIATASDDATTKIWDAQSGKELATLPGHTEGVQYVTFSPDGRTILTAGADGTARQYLVDFNDLMSLAASRLTRTLTSDERATYLGEPLPTFTPINK